jgi:hypothetical protein
MIVFLAALSMHFLHFAAQNQASPPMKPSSEYCRVRPATLKDFVQFLDALRGIPLLPGTPEADIHARALTPEASDMNALEAAILAGGPLPDWLEAAKAEYLAKPIVEIPRGRDGFLCQATKWAELEIREFEAMIEAAGLEPPGVVRSYKDKLEGVQKAIENNCATRGDWTNKLALELYYLTHEQHREWAFSSPETLIYGRRLFYNWLEAQIKALEAPATPPPAQEPPKNPPRPVFSPEAQEAILEALKHLAPDGGAKLADLLAGGAVGPVAFSGSTKGLAVLMRNVYGLGHIGGVNKTALAEWLHRSFGFGEKVALNTLKDYVLKPAKAPDGRKYRIPTKLIQKK